MRKLFVVLLCVFSALLMSGVSTSVARANSDQDQQNTNANTNSNRRKLGVPHRRRHSGRDKPKSTGIKHSYGQAGKSAGRGGKRFGKHMRHGRPIRGGKEFGKGMGGFGKGVGKGTAKTGKKVGSKIKHAVTP
jgi:uncharacterized protein YceK